MTAFRAWVPVIFIAERGWKLYPAFMISTQTALVGFTRIAVNFKFHSWFAIFWLFDTKYWIELKFIFLPELSYSI